MAYKNQTKNLQQKELEIANLKKTLIVYQKHLSQNKKDSSCKRATQKKVGNLKALLKYTQKIKKKQNNQNI